MNVNELMILCLVSIKISVLQMNSPTNILRDKTVALIGLCDDFVP